MPEQALHLGVNIDHVATLRQVRGVTYPSVLEAAEVCTRAGAHGITAHLREDRRHIQDHDIRDLKAALSIPLNLEMGNAPEIVDIALDVQPAEVCLVPEKREELTTEGGLDVVGQKEALASTCRAMADVGIAVSLFIDPDPDQIDASAALGVPMVELHTGTYCNETASNAEGELARLIEGARRAHAAGLQVNAGHGITLDNIEGILSIPYMDTLNIGHSIVAHAVFVGLEAAVEAMLVAMQAYRGGTP